MDLHLFVDAATGKTTGGQGIVVISEDPTNIYFEIRLPLAARVNQLRAEMTAIWTGLQIIPNILTSYRVDPHAVYLNVYSDSKGAVDALYMPHTQSNKKIRLLIKRIWKKLNGEIAQPLGGGCTFHVLSKKGEEKDNDRIKFFRKKMARAHELSRKARAAFKDI